MLRKVFAIMILSILSLSIGGATKAADPARSAVNAEQCTVEDGQSLIDQGRYEQAVREFSCVIDQYPTEVEGYRGRIEATVLLARYSDAVRDYQRVTAFVLPVHPDAKNIILAGYAARLDNAPQDVNALTGASFARWWFFDYASAIHLLNRLIAIRPNDLYPNLFRGSSRLLSGANKAKGVTDLENAILLSPANPHVRFIVADAYTYGIPDPERAFAEASLALNWGLDTPRVHAILGTAYNKFGNLSAAAYHIQKSIDLVTTELVATSPLFADTTLRLGLAPGRTYVIPVQVIAGETISVTTSSRDFWDTILVLRAPDGTPVLGSDDDNAYFAEFEYTAPVSGTYQLKVTSFESVNTGELVVTRN
jgi:tetratricopeptide (TPR) repeat protein